MGEKFSSYTNTPHIYVNYLQKASHKLLNTI